MSSGSKASPPHGVLEARSSSSVVRMVAQGVRSLWVAAMGRAVTRVYPKGVPVNGAHREGRACRDPVLVLGVVTERPQTVQSPCMSARRHFRTAMSRSLIALP